MTIYGKFYDPFSAETFRVFADNPSLREEIVNASRLKYSIPKEDVAKPIAEEEATIIRRAEERRSLKAERKEKKWKKRKEKIKINPPLPRLRRARKKLKMNQKKLKKIKKKTLNQNQRLPKKVNL